MPLTLGLTGMDPATEAALKAAFDDANARLGHPWRLVPEAEAEHIVVDMDSMYGPMSWLRLHAAGKHVIGLTSAPRTQTDFRLGRPFDAHQMTRLLQDIARQFGSELIEGAATETTPEELPAPASTQAPVRAYAPAPAPAPPPEPTPPPVADTAAGPEPASPPPAMPTREQTSAAAAPSPAPATTAAPEPPAPARATTFADWLAPGALRGRVRYRRDSGPTLLIDPVAGTWHGPTPLKPIAAYFEGAVHERDFDPVDEARWAAESAAAGPPQPLSRLRWLGGLIAGKGALLPGYDPAARYALNKWPQTEREYPKHFRIATAMMKGPATVADIAAASGMSAAEVADFVNANLVTGYAEPAPEPPPEPAEPPKPSGLLGRLRGR